MGLCSDPPPPPDMSGSIEAMENYTTQMGRIADDQLAWSREQFADNQALLNRVLDVQLPTMADNAANAREDREFYERVYRPLEEDLVDEFKNYDTEERREQEAGEAVADVTTAMEAQRENALQRLEGYGIDPSQTRSQALDASARIEEAAMQAGAANTARRNVENTGRALRGEAINIGKGYAGNVAQAYNTSTNAGNSAISGANNTMSTGSTAMNSAIGNFSNVASGISGGAAIQNSSYQNELSAFNARPNIAATIIGAGAGGYASRATFAEGGEVVGPGGPKTDSIPTAITPPGVGGPAALSDGEYVIPQEVVRWKGLEHIEKMVSNSQQAMAQRTAISPDGGVTGAIPPNQVNSGVT